MSNMRLWAFLFFCLISVNAGAAEEGALTRAAKSFLKPQKFPTVFNDASFSTRIQVLAQGYEPWETEYDSAGRCISGCAYSTMNIEEDLRQMQQATQNAVIELQDLGYLPAKPTSDHSHQGQTVPPKQVVSTQTDKPHQGQAPLNNLQPVQLVKPPVKDQIQQTPSPVAPEKPSVPDKTT